MNDGDAVLTRKGQVTIPAEIRRALGWQRGDRLRFTQENGAVRVIKAQSVVEQTAGALSRYRLDRAPTDQEMDEAIARAVVEDVMGEASRG